ncbi:uncharacterized protein N7473_012598 [Penicillium subrubescens]|uniref:Uncharacterized protein n=1 Tax=Penicillium subrubescens TaxID=1316194 RepID=A0A1Q5U4Q8_9EURO|nr:uncharacterized protein N7473_012598 [Penicillium subrubescens]KAJ5875251.1 hypothetical protein N7473_012598 [Penicillium subrubescens]OKP07459.1 hypothetical protein PENSUB_6048 [Penicillium subrubescens]
MIRVACPKIMPLTPAVPKKNTTGDPIHRRDIRINESRTSFTRSPCNPQLSPIFGPLRSVFGRDVNLTILGAHYPEPDRSQQHADRIRVTRVRVYRMRSS